MYIFQMLNLFLGHSSKLLHYFKFRGQGRVGIMNIHREGTGAFVQ
jgi:hypothetical protein